MKTNIFATSERNDLSDFNCHWWYGKEFIEHSHDYYEIMISTLGELAHYVNNEEYRQTKGDVCILAPGTSHYLKSANNDFIKHYNIAIKKEYFDAFLENKSVLKKYFEDNSFLNIKLKDTTYAYIYETIQKIDNMFYGAVSYTQVESIIYAIMTEVLLKVSTQNKKTNRITNYCYDAIRKINNYTYITKKATDIYDIYPVSHTSFVTEFKKITGKTLIAYLAEKKLAYAKNLLITTDSSILEISSLLQYDSLSHFIRIFKNYYGETPYKYKRSNSKEDFNLL